MSINLHLDVEKLHDVIPGHAVVSSDGTTATFGTWADGGHVSMLLTGGDRERNILITGATGSGKTSLLRSLQYGAEAVGIHVDLCDSGNRHLIADVHTAVLERARDLADRNERTGVGVVPLRILLVDDLTTLDADTASLLGDVVRMGPKTNVAVVGATQDASALTPGGALLRDNLKAGGEIELRAMFGDIPAEFANGTTTAGVGLVHGDLFRAWWPGQGRSKMYS